MIRKLLLTLALVPTALTQAQSLNLIPIPREVAPGAVQSLPQGLQISCAQPCPAADIFAIDDLKQFLASQSIPVNSSAFSTITITRFGSPLSKSIYAESLSKSAAAQDPPASWLPEGYSIIPDGKGLAITAASDAGVFYALQTVKQLITGTGNTAILHTATIRDWPALKYRGLHDDLSRGPVPTLEFQKHLIHTLAAYKVNVYSPYFENTQQYASNPLLAPPGGSISAQDARDLVAYAAQFHITVIPEQEAFGHLRHSLIWEQYQPLAETPHGAVLAPSQPGSIPLIHQMFFELANLYPGPFVHIGADETIDLGVGQTKADVEARGLGAVYLDFLQRIVNDLAPLHKKILFWGDIAQDSPALLKAMPQSFKSQTIAVAWGYSPNPKGFEKTLKPFTDAGMETWVSPSINNYRQVYPNQQLALEDIQEFTRDGQRFGATGQLNTLWNDDGESLASQNWYGILFGAACAWQQGESSIPAFQQSYAQAFHGDATGLLNQAQTELTTAMSLLHDGHVIAATEGTDGLFWIDPWSKDGAVVAAKMRPLSSPVRLHAERALTLIAQARAANPQLREQDAITGMDLGARRIDFLALKFQLADEMASAYARAYIASTTTDPKIRRTLSRELSDINGINGRIQDLTYGYAQIRDLFEASWLTTNRPYALHPVLAHYDAAIALWLSRMDKVRSAQRQWSDSRSLPPASSLDIPIN